MIAECHGGPTWLPVVLTKVLACSVPTQLYTTTSQTDQAPAHLQLATPVLHGAHTLQRVGPVRAFATTQACSLRRSRMCLGCALSAKRLSPLVASLPGLVSFGAVHAKAHRRCRHRVCHRHRRRAQGGAPECSPQRYCSFLPAGSSTDVVPRPARTTMHAAPWPGPTVGPRPGFHNLDTTVSQAAFRSGQTGIRASVTI